jgi:hypothetical protein
MFGTDAIFFLEYFQLSLGELIDVEPVVLEG